MRRGSRPWLLALLIGCGGSTQAPAPQSAQPEPSGPASAQSAQAPAEDEATAGDKMMEHFRLVRAARDAVINGSLSGAKKPLQQLADGDYGIETPQEWMQWLTDMQSEARRGVQAKDLGEAARAVAGVARQCGECHSAHREGPEFAGQPRMKLPPPLDVRDQMGRHQRAAQLLWRGLTVPAHETWIAGAKALTETWVPDPTRAPQAAEDPLLADEINAVSAMGVRLREAQTPHARAEAYGDMIAACGACHARRTHP